MARKTSKPDWRELAEAAQTGETPYLWRSPLDEWVDVDVDMTTLTENKPDKPDGPHEFNWFSVDMKHRETNGLEMNEIPFWCRSDFLLEALESDEPEIEMKYRRSKDGKVNSGEWRLR